MIGYAMLDEELPQQPQPRQQIMRKQKQIVQENTECNYLVMFFILGVFLLVISDQIK